MTTAGLTGCQAGWLLMSLDVETSFSILQDKELDEALAGFERIFTDIPVGLSDNEPDRLCDRMLRERLGEKKDREPPAPPIRAALEAPSYVEANVIYLDQFGIELSVRSWSQFPRVRLLDRMAREEETLKKRLYQSNPELLFTQLNGRKIYQERKKKKGLKHRLDLLEEKRPVTGELFRELKENFRRNELKELEILNSLALAFAANHSAEQQLKSLPDDPPEDKFGLRMGIYYI